MSAPLIPPAPAKTWRTGTLTYTTAGLVVLFAWLLWGDFAWQLKERSITPLAQLLLKKHAASDLFVGIMVGSLPAALGMIFGPMISVRSDRHRGRWGRRIPFLLIPIPVVMLSMAGLAFTPRIGAGLHELLGAHSPGVNICVLIAFGFIWTIFDLTTVITSAVFGGLINDVVPQPVIGRFFGLFRAVSLIDGIIFNYFLLGHAEEYFFWMFIGIGTFYGLAFALMCWKVKEGDYPPPPPPAPPGQGRLTGLRTYLRECYAQPYYLWIFAAHTLCTLSFGPINGFSIFFAKSLEMDMAYFGKHIALTYAFSLALAYPLGSLADRFHPLRVGLVAIALYAGVTAWGAFHATEVRGFGIALVAHGVLSGTYITAMASIGQRLYPKLKFAQFASAAGIVTALFQILLPPAMGAWLDATGHVYRHTYAASAILAALGFCALLVVYKKFLRLGGPKAYVAP